MCALRLRPPFALVAERDASWGVGDVVLAGDDWLRATQGRPRVTYRHRDAGTSFSSQIAVDQNGSRRLESRMNLSLVDEYNRKQEGEK